MSYDEHLQADARLVILKELARQPGGSLNDTMIGKVLDSFGYRRSRDWWRAQLRKLEDVGAITLTEAGTVLIASITRAGIDHVERRSIIDAVARPSPGG